MTEAFVGHTEVKQKPMYSLLLTTTWDTNTYDQAAAEPTAHATLHRHSDGHVARVLQTASAWPV